MGSRELPSRVASPPELTASDVTASLYWHALTQTYPHAHTQQLNGALEHTVRQAKPHIYSACVHVQTHTDRDMFILYIHRRWKTHNNWHAQKQTR